MLLVAQSQQAKTQEWSTCQIERLRCFQRAQAPYFCVAVSFSHFTQVDQRQLKLQLRQDYLKRLSFKLYEDSPQDFKALHYLVDTSFDQFAAQWSSESIG